MIKVYIPEENVTGEIVLEMAHSALIHFEKGGFRREVILLKEDYVVIEELFFDHEEI